MAMSTRGYSRALTANSIIGVLLSVYALYVEMALEAEPNYEALCDISERMSCTKVLGSEYAKGFGLAQTFLGEESFLNIPNCAHGIIFYLLLIFLATFDQPAAVRVQHWLAVASCVTSLYLAYILLFVLFDLCVVCVSTYAVNIANLMLTRGKLASIARPRNTAAGTSVKSKKRLE